MAHSRKPHRYLSTACFHALTDGSGEVRVVGPVTHERCRMNCKFCGSPCVCPCHKGVDPQTVRNAVLEFLGTLN